MKWSLATNVSVGIDIDFFNIETIDIDIDIDFLIFGKLTLALTLTFFKFNVNGVQTHQSLPVFSIIKGNAPSNPCQNQKKDASIQFTCLFEARFHKNGKLLTLVLTLALTLRQNMGH